MGFVLLLVKIAFCVFGSHIKMTRDVLCILM